MALNFPNNPSEGDQYTSGSTTWEFDGTVWNVLSADGAKSFGTIGIGTKSVNAKNASDRVNLTAGPNIQLIADPGTNNITISAIEGLEGEINLGNDFELNVTADDSTVYSISSGETLQILGGTGIETSTDSEGNIVITNNATVTTAFEFLTDVQTAGFRLDRIAEPAMARFVVDNIGVSAYLFPSHYSGNNPNIYVLSGTTVAFDLNAVPGHPFEIQDALGNPYNTGLIHVDTDGTTRTGSDAQNKDVGTLYWRIPESISGGYRYQCTAHPAMVGAITVKRLSIV